MAQQTGTNILALSRVLAQDADAGGAYAVSDTNALTMLNDVLIRWCNNVRQRAKYLAATTTGLTFTAGLTSKLTTAGVNIADIGSVYPANANTLTFPLAPGLQRATVEEILEMYNDPADGSSVPQASGEWSHYAPEKTGESQDQWRLWVYPALNRTRYLTIKAPVYVTVSALSDTPDVDEVDARYISRFLAYEMARLQKEANQAFLDGILAPVPQDLRRQYFNQAIAWWQLQDSVIEYGEW